MTPADVERVVSLHVAAFPGFFLTFLGCRFLRLLYSQAVERGEIALVAVVGGAPVGFVMGSSEPRRFYSRLIARKGLSFAAAALPAVASCPSAAVRVARALLKPNQTTKPPRTATLMSLAVDPAVQGSGAGKVLVRAFLQEAAARGAARVDLTTDKVDNDRANAFYSALGFRVAREVVTPEGRVLNEYEIDL